ncbi:MAG TPA: hypothetical protein PKW33_16940 [Anaerolineaceae bacterium]|nr:hypothetical protein [Anaerolineaceae bacterium]HPN53286.1 hypothetical protein [Anaerolineaceae bacterium]
MPPPLVTLLAIGSQGVVQPFAAPGEGLLRSGLWLRPGKEKNPAARLGWPQEEVINRLAGMAG